MIYLIGGASRAGKSYTAKRLLERIHVPIFELDYLKMGLYYGMPEYGVHPLRDEATLGELLWPIVKGMIRPMIENGDDYIIEGTYILPEYAVEMQDAYGAEVRSCFLGYAEMSVQEKQAEMDQYRDANSMDDEARAQEIVDLEHFIWFSQFLRDECPRLGLRYIEVDDRERAADETIEWLLNRNSTA